MSSNDDAVTSNTSYAPPKQGKEEGLLMKPIRAVASDPSSTTVDWDCIFCPGISTGPRVQ